MTVLSAPWSLSITEAALQIRAGDLKPSNLVRSTLSRIEQLDPLVRAFVVVDRQGALARAAELDAEQAHGVIRGPLHGIPIAVKDIFDVKGFATGCGSRAYEGRPPAAEDSTAVARLRAAGAVIVGKSTSHELACGVYTPPTRNPWNLDRIPGGSSGGSGAALAAGMVLGATGSDTGGSIRIPAALCGVVGIKPTYGRVSRAGVAALSWSLDHIGPLARSVDDAALLLTAMVGADPRDRTASTRQPPDLSTDSVDSLKGVRIGVPRTLFYDGIEPAVQSAVERARLTLVDLGAAVVDLEIPELAWTLAAEFTIVLSEAASYHEELLRTRAQDIGEEVRGLLEAGSLLPAVQYLRAQRARTRIQEAVHAAFASQKLDVLLAPTLPATAAMANQASFHFGEHEEDVTGAFVRTTAPFNLTGLPVVAVPAGLSPEHLPVGLQFAGRPFDERMVVHVARLYERESGWPLEYREPVGLQAGESPV